MKISSMIGYLLNCGEAEDSQLSLKIVANVKLNYGLPNADGFTSR